MKLFKKTKANKISSVIGPQLGAIFDPCGIRITVAFPDRLDLTSLSCHLMDENSILLDSSLFKKPEDSIFKNFLFVFTKLQEGYKYFYIFKDKNGNIIDLDGGMNQDDCWFYAPSFNTDSDKFVLLSCNNPFNNDDNEEKQFAMWDRLLTTINADSGIKLLIQGGDQLYNDNIEVECLSILKKSPDKRDIIKQKIIKNYQKFYGNIIVRRILAKIPSVAMWDDHDITDGWGGRLESFKKNNVKCSFKPEWQAFFEISSEAFKAYQAIKNPEFRIHKYAQTTYIDFGINRLYLLDLRSEKNITNLDSPLVSKEHEENILESIKRTPDNILNVFVLSPVVPVRINPDFEKKLTKLAYIAFYIRKFSKKFMILHASFFGLTYFLSGLGGIADLTDDLTDSLSAPLNKSFLRKLSLELTKLASEKNKKVLFLSGDIHTGGISEILVFNRGVLTVIPQIVSSPIGSAPMKKLVKDKTTDEEDFQIEPKQGGDGIMARNIFYRSDRNFAIIKANNISSASAVQFYFEKSELPLCFSPFFALVTTSNKKRQEINKNLLYIS